MYFCSRMESENKKLTPMRVLTDVQQFPWGTAEYKLADLGFVDSMACEGYLKGNLCGARPTSCADQLAKAVRQAYDEERAGA